MRARERRQTHKVDFCSDECPKKGAPCLAREQKEPIVEHCEVHTHIKRYSTGAHYACGGYYNIGARGRRDVTPTMHPSFKLGLLQKKPLSSFFRGGSSRRWYVINEMMQWTPSILTAPARKWSQRANEKRRRRRSRSRGTQLHFYIYAPEWNSSSAAEELSRDIIEVVRDTERWRKNRAGAVSLF